MRENHWEVSKMRKTAAHFKPKSTEKPKRKKVVAVTLATALVLALVIALAVAGCKDGGEAGSESSGPAATPTAAPTEEPSPTPEPTPSPTPESVKAFSDGAFQVSCVDFVPLFEKYLQESDPDNENLVMKQVEDSETVTFQLYKGEIDAGITMSFVKDGEPAGEDEAMDSVSLTCLSDSLNGSIWPSAFAVLNQTIQPDLSYMDCLKQIDAGIDDMTTTDSQFSYEIGGVTYKFQMYTDTLFSFTATTNPEQFSTGTDSSEDVADEDVEEDGDASNTGSDIPDAPELVTDPQAFTDSYVAKLKVLQLFEEDYKMSVSATDGGLSHTFNGESTNVQLTFTADGMLLTSSSPGETESQAAFLAMAAIINTITPSVGSIRDCATYVQEMVSELQESGNITEETVYRTVGSVEYGITCPGIIVFTVKNV